MAATDSPLTLVFLGYAGAATAQRAGRFEDDVLALLADYGAQLLFRGRRSEGQDDGLPLEVHILRFPDRAALRRYTDDERRARLLHEYGDVFTLKQTFEVAPVDAPTIMP
jgi:uncharacterized protein (DUF1330 family)